MNRAACAPIVIAGSALVLVVAGATARVARAQQFVPTQPVGRDDHEALGVRAAGDEGEPTIEPAVPRDVGEGESDPPREGDRGEVEPAPPEGGGPEPELLTSPRIVWTLELPDCDLAWLSFGEFASVIRVESRAMGQNVDVVREGSGPHRTIVRVERCDAEVSAVRLELHPPRPHVEPRTIDLSDVTGHGRTRTLAMALVDLWQEWLLAPDPAQREAEPEPERAPAAGAEEHVMPNSSAGELALGALSLSLDGSFAWAGGRAFGGGRATLGVVGAELPFDARLVVEIALSALYAGRGTALGTTELMIAGAAAGAGIMLTLAPGWHLGTYVHVRAAMAVSLGSTMRDDVFTRDGLDPVLDLSVVARLEAHLGGGWFVRVEGGIGRVLRGVQLEVEGLRALSWTDWIVPAHVGVGARL